MPRSTHLARAAVVLATTLAAGACRSGSPGQPDPGPSVPPPAVAAAPPSVVTDEDVQDTKVINVEEMLRGRIAGVEVYTLPSGGISVRIRGATSITQSTEPLFVVDGIPVQSEAGGALTWLSPRDVQRIEVLKDAGSTSFWGSRGANGVVVITTKH